MHSLAMQTLYRFGRFVELDPFIIEESGHVNNNKHYTVKTKGLV